MTIVITGANRRIGAALLEGYAKAGREAIGTARSPKGGLAPLVQQLIGGVRASMGYTGCATIEEMRTRAEFVEITAAGIRESHVHDVQITKEAQIGRAHV